MTIAVTAATGQLGTLVVDKLLERVPASDLVAVVRDAAKAARLAGQGRRGACRRIRRQRRPGEGLRRRRPRAAHLGHRGRPRRPAPAVIDAAVTQGWAARLHQRARRSHVHAARRARPPGHRAYLAELGSRASSCATAGTTRTTCRPSSREADRFGPDQRRRRSVASAARADFAEAAAVVLTSDDVEGVYGSRATSPGRRPSSPPRSVPRDGRRGFGREQREILTGAGVARSGSASSSTPTRRSVAATWKHAGDLCRPDRPSDDASRRLPGLISTAAGVPWPGRPRDRARPGPPLGQQWPVR